MSDNMPTLECYTPAGGLASGNFAPFVRRYQREIIEGPYRATFELVAGEGGVDRSGLRAWFQNRMMWQIREQWQGRETWRGYIYEMELHANGQIDRKSMEDFANAIKVAYGDNDHTGFYPDGTNDREATSDSIERYGRFELIVDGYSDDQTVSEQQAQDELFWRANPYTQPTVYTDTPTEKLVITAVGAMVLANRYYLLSEEATGTATTVSQEIYDIVDECVWLEPYDIPLSGSDYNSTEVYSGVSSNTPAFDRLTELARIPLVDSDTGERTFFRLQILPDGGVIYRPLEQVADYYSYPPPNGVQRLDGSTPTWDAWPGIVRRVENRGSPPPPQSYIFGDDSYTFAERVAMAEGDPVASFLPRQYSVGDYYRELAAQARWAARWESRFDIPEEERITGIGLRS